MPADSLAPQTLNAPCQVAVRALCAFTAKHGDLDLRFTPAPSAQEGIAGHALVASRRGEHYESEVALEGNYRNLTVRGRADGYDPEANRLEEVKTFRGDLGTMAANKRALHWAQLKIYGHLICQARGLAQINLALVYFDVANAEESPLEEAMTAAELREFFEAQCAVFLRWAMQEMAHRQARDAALGDLKFPHTDFRPGQRELASAVYRNAQRSGCLMIEAPTGIGKTVGTIFPLLKAMPSQRLDKIFVLSAKTPGRKLALDALELIAQGQASVRVVEMIAREKSCEHPDKACHGDSCPLAKGFYDRLPAARLEAASSPAALNQSTLRSIALGHRICPYYLSQEMVNWADVVVGDYNYYFDTSALLHAMTVNNGWRVSLLLDEAHNLIARARSMYSATLDQAQLATAHRAAPKAVRGALERLNQCLDTLSAAQPAPWQVLSEVPQALAKALQHALSTLTDFLLANPTRVDAELQAFYFEALHFSRMAEAFGTHSMLDLTQAEDAGGDLLNLRNIVPAPFLAARFAAAQSSVLFSATLSPFDFYQQTLGLPTDCGQLKVGTPFRAEQLDVRASRRISSRYADRADSLAPICQAMALQYARAPGNYIAFVSSYEYLAQLHAELQRRHPSIPTWTQSRHMLEAEREQFLARFTPTSTGIAFAVLGGAFAEGVDLPGRRLIGAFIATLGLPQTNPVNEHMQTQLAKYWADQAAHNIKNDSCSGTESLGRSPVSSKTLAYKHTFLYPGLQKVVQAAGRVIRTPEDRGAVLLLCNRFLQPEVRALLPEWWEIGLLD